MLVSSREKSVPFLVNPFFFSSFSPHSYWMVMESYDCDLWRRYTWETAKFRFYGRPAYRGARQWTAKCTYGAVLPPNNDTRKRRKSPWDQWDPVPSHEILDFFLSSLFLYSVYDIHYRIASLNIVYEGYFERFRRRLYVKKWKSSRKGMLFLFLWGSVFGKFFF